MKQNEYQNVANKHRRPMTFNEKDQVWIHLWKKHFFLPDHHRELKLKTDDPFRILKRIRENTYQIDFPSDYRVLTTFNFSNRIPYHVEERDNLGWVEF